MASREELKLIVTAQNRAKGVLGNLQKQIVGIGTAYLGWRVAKDIIGRSIAAAADYEANLKSLEAVAGKTGRNMNEIYAAMQSQVGGLASKASIASGFLKGMTTELTVDQVNNLTTSIRNASIAMGESFETQFPLIIKAVKQLNPAILDNIGVTVRLDQVNKKIREGFYGIGEEINETTQQHAIYTEIMRQTAKYQGQEKELLTTTKGAWDRLKASISNVNIEAGRVAGQGGLLANTLNLFADAADSVSGSIEAANSASDNWFESLALSSTLIWESIFGVDEYRKSVDLLAFAQKNAADEYQNDMKRMLEFGEQFMSESAKAARVTQEAIAKEEAARAESFESFMKELRDADVEYQNYVANMIAYSQQLQSGVIQPLRAIEDELKSFHKDVFEDLMIGSVDATKAIETVQTETAEKQKSTTQQLLDNMANAARGSEGAWINAANSIAVTMPKKINKAAEWVAAQWENVGHDVINIWAGASARMADGIVNAFQGMRVDIGNIAQAIAGDFARYFLQKAIFSLSGGLLGFFGGLFDNPVNDAMAAQQGYDFGRYFNQGFQRAMSSASFVSQPGMAASTGGSINIHFHGPVTDRGFVRSVVIPEIERAARRRDSKLALRPQLITGV